MKRLFVAVVAALAALTAVSTAGAETIRTERVVRSQTGSHVWTYVYDNGKPVSYVLQNYDAVGRPLDTQSGALREAGDKEATGTGRLFDPNPVAALQDETLTDQKDSDYAALRPAYVLRTLTNLDGSGYLRGDYADIQGTTSTAFDANNRFVFNRHDDAFEQVTAYYAITSAQTYLQSLGFRNVNNEPQRVKVDQYGVDNSYYSPKQDVIKFGKGDVDDAEDTEVVWHELGHAIQDAQVKNFGTTLEAGSIGEGFGDYWAYTMSLPTGGGFDPACIADWDSTGYTAGPVHCLRRVDLDLHWPADDRGEVHANGRIWSRALRDINLALGRTVADTIIIEGQFSYTPDVTFAGASNATIAAAQRLYGTKAADACRAAFRARGFIS